MTLKTTATEPFEFRGFIRLDWSDGVFAVETENEVDMPRHVVRADQVYSTDQGMGWSARPMNDPGLSSRVALWDLRLLVESGEVERDGDRLDIAGTVHGYTYNVVATLDGDRISHATIRSPQGRESPFTLVAGGPGPTFTEVPEQSMAWTAARQGSQEAREGHGRIIAWINSHLETRGDVPEQISPESLQAQMLVDPGEWPRNPFSGQPMADAVASGHFSWAYCGPRDATYLGYGWDGTILTQSYGAGCSLQ